MVITRQLITDNTISAFRTALIAFGSIFVSADLFPQSDIDKYIGIIMDLVAFGWIVYANFQRAPAIAAAFQAGVQEQAASSGESVVKHLDSAEKITAKLNTEQLPAKPVTVT